MINQIKLAWVELFCGCFEKVGSWIEGTEVWVKALGGMWATWSCLGTASSPGILGRTDVGKDFGHVGLWLVVWTIFFYVFGDDQEVDFDSQEQWTMSINQPHLRISALQHSGGLAQLLPHLGRALVVILSFKTIQCWWLMVDDVSWCSKIVDAWLASFIHSHPFPSGFGAPRPRTLGQTLASVAGAERAARLETGGKAAPSTGQCPAETPGSKRPWRNQQGYGEHIWRIPQMGVTPIAGWFIMENPI